MSSQTNDCSLLYKNTFLPLGVKLYVIAKYYANRLNRHDRLTPYKPYEEYYVENADRVKNGILTIAQFVAKQDYEGLIEYMNTF